jgi:hypothetical protein
MTEMLTTPDTTKVLPIPLQTLTDKLDLFAGFDRAELQMITAHQPAALPERHPAISLMRFRARPELWDVSSPETHDAVRLERRREAYRYGVTVASSLLLRRSIQLGLDTKTEEKVADDSVVTGEIFDAARISSRFLVSQFIDTDEDVLDIIIDHMEMPALQNHMPWLTGHEHDPGHRDYFHVGLGDRLAEYAIRRDSMRPETVPLV